MMKKIYLLSGSLLVAALSLISWGFKGHRAVASIAQQHLSATTAYTVGAYLKGEAMADVSTWADENKNTTTAPWHFLNLALGLNHEQFVKAVSEMGNDNVYSAILKTEAILKEENVGIDQKNEALKYLIHLVGDAHQPMHISRKEDKGGNTIQLRFEDKGTNLHSLWDSKMIDHEGLSEAQIAKQYDTATPVEIKKWQADSPMEWIWESYQISSRLYGELKPGQTIDEVYYQKNIGVIHQRVDQAGIRLAGELNRILKDQKVKVTQVILTPPAPQVQQIKAAEIALADVKNAVGKEVTVTGKVFGSRDIGSMVLVNLGAAYPNQQLTVALKGSAKIAGAGLEEKTITVTGKVIDYKGKPEIIITDVAQIVIK
ncbi:S1/P1 nuclease [Mucilaginibacter terrae]|uniref:S1/P1 nuclease n=1 Tax=Mucilaginibacter terrae TaxID=1955052 RepID=UPI00363EDE60